MPEPGLPSVCPVCRKDDRITRISSVLGEETSRTSGTATSAGVAGGRTFVASTRTETHSASTLATALGDPSPAPDDGSGRGLIYGLVAFFVAPFLFAAFGARAGGAALGMVVAIPVAYIVGRSRSQGAYERQAKLWDQARHVRDSGYYCARDDVAWGSDSRPLPPSEYRDRCFAAYLKIRTQKRSRRR